MNKVKQNPFEGSQLCCVTRCQTGSGQPASDGHGRWPDRGGNARLDSAVNLPYKRRSRSAQVAQLVEQRTENPCVGGSIPPLGTTEASGVNPSAERRGSQDIVERSAVRSRGD